MKTMWAVAVLAVALSTSACDSTHKTAGTGGPGATPGAALPRITIVRTGGIAGVNDTLAVEPTGAWTATDKAGKQRSGQLTTAQVDSLRPLAADPALAGEAGQSRAPSNCADAFNYVVTVGSERIAYEDCPGPDEPVATAKLVAQVISVLAGNS